MGDQPVRWGVLGCASIALDRVIPAMAGADKATLVAIASRALPKAEQAAARLSIPKAYGSYEALLADPEVEVVYIPLPNGLHVEWAITAMRAGKHVLCEKPIAVNAEEARELEAVRDETGRYCLEAYASRFNPVQARAVEIARSGDLGELRFMHTVSSFLMTVQNPEDVRLQASIGGGALYDMGCYALDAQRLVAGRPPIRAWATMQWSERFDVDIAGTAMLDYGGLMGTVQWGFNVPWGGPFSVIGEAGRLTGPYGWGAPAGEPAMLLQVGGATERIVVAETINGYTAEVQDLSEAVRGLHPPRFVGESLVDNMRTIDACYESQRSGRAEAV
ncbi:MAG: Gfo/Idh/MocA family oxidoreductase [Anaerolineae bacterium]|nr:Gfo/Idh/MocA family oxidoreductase [Anaerolineae bacterium]